MGPIPLFDKLDQRFDAEHGTEQVLDIDGVEASVVRELQPRRVIPVQYVSGPTPKACDLTSLEPFLKAMAGTPVKRVGRTLSLPGKLGNGLQVDVLR